MAIFPVKLQIFWNNFLIRCFFFNFFPWICNLKEYTKKEVLCFIDFLYSFFRRGSLVFWRPLWSSYRGHHYCRGGHSTFTLDFSWTFTNSQWFDVIITSGFISSGILLYNCVFEIVDIVFMFFIYFFLFLQQIAITCWCIKFRPQDHNFLHQSHVFSTISKILSR